MIKKYDKLSLRYKLVFLFLIVILTIFGINLIIYMKVNQSIQEINSVYSTNVDTNELSDTISQVQWNMYEYLNTRSSESLENYYRSEQEYQSLIDGLNQENTDNSILMLEKNIRSMSVSYMGQADETIQAKRGRNVEKYKSSYEKTTELYGYITEYISTTNNEHFKQNIRNYEALLSGLNKVEIASFAVIIGVALISFFLIWVMTGNMLRPLDELARAANQVSDGTFDVELSEPVAQDEIGIVTRAFNTMIGSIRNYIEQIRVNASREQEMKEKELLMQTHLKDAQLKYLQAQINPHFLYNTLNAGAQLAMMEDAEQTCAFVERMAEFFRYNVRKMKEDTTLAEEIAAVDNYMYIINVRFAGEIQFEKYVKTDLTETRVPSMILQPLVENSVNHGLRDVTWERRINLTVDESDKGLTISVRDNGCGMDEDMLTRALRGESRDDMQDVDTTGVGINNVKNRLELYYGQSDLFMITSEGKNKGTEVKLVIPLSGKKELYV